jgi:hypothetical protein
MQEIYIKERKVYSFRIVNCLTITSTSFNIKMYGGREYGENKIEIKIKKIKIENETNNHNRLFVYVFVSVQNKKELIDAGKNLAMRL